MLTKGTSRALKYFGYVDAETAMGASTSHRRTDAGVSHIPRIRPVQPFRHPMWQEVGAKPLKPGRFECFRKMDAGQELGANSQYPAHPQPHSVQGVLL